MVKIKNTSLNRGTSGNVVTIIIVVILGAFMLLPLVYVISNAFKPIDELYRFPPTIFVQNPTTKNFVDMFNLIGETNMSFLRYVFNTLFLTTCAALGQIILASLCAYSISKIPFPGAKTVFRVIVFSLMFSDSVTAVPKFILFSKLGIVDTYFGMIIPSLVSTMGLFLMKQFMDNTIPNDLLEAARIDGAGEIKIFFRIVMPLLKPAWLTLVILSIKTSWGAPSSNTYREVFKTLPQALEQISSGGISRTGVSSAASLVMLIIPIVAFIVTQSKMVDTMGSAGLKG